MKNKNKKEWKKQECRYCGKEISKTLSGNYVCNCKNAQKEWSISIKIQCLRKELGIRQKELSKLQKSSRGKNEKER